LWKAGIGAIYQIKDTVENHGMQVYNPANADTLQRADGFAVKIDDLLHQNTRQ